MHTKKPIIDIAGIGVSLQTDEELIESIEDAIQRNINCTIAYYNARTVNYVYKRNDFTAILNGFDIVHADGVGVYFASRFLYGKNGLVRRFSGSDFYNVLIKNCISRKRRLFFFGHDDQTLHKIKSNHPDLEVAGLQNGYEYDDDLLIHNINSSSAEILICGLGMPRQENWIIQNRGKLNCRVMICTGEGIRVFSGTKLRGPLFLRNLGLEWFVRFLSNPFKYFGRYIIGNPLFLYRIIVLKLRNLRR